MDTVKYIIESVFSVALFANAILFIPQILKIIKEKSSLGLSFITFLGFLLIQFSTVLHALIYQDYLLVTGYLFSMLTCGSVVALILIYRKNHNPTESEITLEEILAQLPGHIYWKNKHGVCLGSNTNNWSDFGLKSIEEFKGKTDYDLFSKEEADLLRHADEEVITTGKLKIVEEYLTVTNSSALYLSHKLPLKNKSGKIVGILGISIDITEAKKQIEERLEMLENIIALMPGNVYWMNNQGIYLGCNNNQAKAIGFSSRTEIIGKTNHDIKGFLIPEILDKVNEGVMTFGKTAVVEEPAIFPDGAEAVFLSSKSPLRNRQGEIIGMVGISFDITERKKNENELQDKLQDTRQKLEGMTLVSASIAHELRTPLAAFNIATDNLKEVYPYLINAYLWAREQNAPIEDIAPAYIKGIENSLGIMNREIKAAFTFIDIALMKTNFYLEKDKIEILCLKAIVEETLERYPFGEKQHHLICWHPPEKTILVHANKLMLIHILFNLIKNALYYLAKASKGNIEIWLGQSDLSYRLYFKDTGAGIPSNVLPHIFDRFFSQTYLGTGVGLTFCKNVMRAFNGDIQCESVEGEYTLFTLSFPICLDLDLEFNPIDFKENSPDFFKSLVGKDKFMTYFNC